VQAASESEIRDDLARRQWDDLDDLDAAVERAISDVEQPQVRSMLPEEATFRCIVDYVGAYAYWDLPSGELGTSPQQLRVVEGFVSNKEKLPSIDTREDVPIVDVWG